MARPLRAQPHPRYGRKARQPGKLNEEETMKKVFVQLNGMTEAQPMPAASYAEEGNWLVLRDSNNNVIGRFNVNDLLHWWTPAEWEDAP